MIAARPHDINDHWQAVLDMQAALAHRARGTDDLVDALALERKRRQQRGGLNRRKARVHDLADKRGCLVGREILSAQQATQERRKFSHWERKFSTICSPLSLSTDSG